MEISNKAKFLVRNIVMKNVTYKEVMECKAVKEDDTLAAQIDAYIESQKLNVDKTV